MGQWCGLLIPRVAANCGLLLALRLQSGASVGQRWADYGATGFHSSQPASPVRIAPGASGCSCAPRRLAWKGFSPQLSLVHEVRETSARGCAYERTGGELRAARLF